MTSSSDGIDATGAGTIGPDSIGPDSIGTDAASVLLARISGLDERVAVLEAATGPVPRPDGPREAAHRPADRPSPPDWSRLPVRAGAVTTVGGVVMLLALAATAGWLSPPVRVLCGAVLGVALLVAGTRVASRSAPGPASVALAGTGLLALFCSLAAATALYPLLPVAAGLAGCLAAAAGGIALADRWRSLPLALGVLVAAEVALPVVGGGPGALGLGLAAVLQAAAGVSALRRVDRERWAVLNPVAALATAVHGLLAAVLALITDSAGDDVAVVAVAAVALALGTAVAALAALRPPPVPPVLTVVLAPVPLLVSAAVVGGGTGVVVCAAAGVAMALVAAARVLYRGVRLGAAAAAGVLVMTSTALLLDGSALTLVLLVEALALLTVAAVLRMRTVLTAGVGFAVPGVALCAGQLAGPSALLGPLVRWDGAGPATVGAGLLVLVAAATLGATRRSGRPGPDTGRAGVRIPAAVTGLYGTSWLVVTGTQRVLPGETGFLTGHVLVTVGITALGLVVLARSVARPPAHGAGLLLVGAALAKLVLFDLPALDGLGRVAAFIGAGLLLLAVGGRYANRVAADRLADAGPAERSGSGGPEAAVAGTGSEPAAREAAETSGSAP